LTQKSEAQKGNITPEMEFVAKEENIDVNKLVKLIDNGKVVIPFIYEEARAFSEGMGAVKLGEKYGIKRI